MVSASSPMLRPFLRKGAYKARYDPAAARERVGARLAAKAQQLPPSTPTPRANAGQHRLTPLSEAATGGRLPPAHGCGRRVHEEHKMLVPPQPPLAQHFAGVSVSLAPPPARVQQHDDNSRRISMDEFEKLEELAASADRGSEIGFQTRSPRPLRLAEEPISSLATTPVRGTPVRAAVEGGGEGEASSPPIRPASNGDEPGSQWWDALTLQMNLPDSPEKVAAPQPRPASRLVESRAHPAHLSSANPPFLALASISEPPPTSRLVTSLFHSSRPCAPDASARRPVTAGASALVPAHHLASSTASLNIGGSVKQPADAMLMPGDEAEAEAAMLQRDSPIPRWAPAPYQHHHQQQQS
ncbi:hypothetical protein T492DRAFT_835289 [Pavlovales sp. CCMP2436]|nr:hypothetical protein T492DRAFT_835289 [Pavlovales sp. CCMP2436]